MQNPDPAPGLDAEQEARLMQARTLAARQERADRTWRKARRSILALPVTLVLTAVAVAVLVPAIRSEASTAWISACTAIVVVSLLTLGVHVMNLWSAVELLREELDVLRSAGDGPRG